ncbi:hypothetical protein INT45_007774 [Circinella minor]|uniref:Uncharacterized protein n=1 Tax=Circinella minor TaxID=1195481 RepID=A0A8H7S000_9FUNG|nr:hypothetical protein INT45_007774 [Circinella minor]
MYLSEQSPDGVPLPGTVTIDPGDAIVIAFYGVVVAYSAEVLYRCLALRLDPNERMIRFFKSVMATSFFIKAILFMTFDTNDSVDCNATVRVADFFYHFGITSGDAVLLLRLKAVVPVNWQFPMNVFHLCIIIFRLGVGIIDVVVIDYATRDGAICTYLENSFANTAIDLYVTIMIGFFLSKHIRRLRATRTQGNVSSYIGILIQNIIRTTILTIVNLISAIFILEKTTIRGIMVIWPIVNLLFVVLIGYDADLAQAVRRLHSCICNCSLPQHSSPTQRTQLRNNNADGGRGEGRNIDSYYTSSLAALPCIHCGQVRRPSIGGGNSTSIPMFRGMWSDSRIPRQRCISRTPSFLATTTISSVSTTDTHVITSREEVSPGYYSAVQSSLTSPYNSSMPELLSPRLQQQPDLSSSNDCLANAFYDANLLIPSRSHSLRSFTSANKKEKNKSDNNDSNDSKDSTVYNLQQPHTTNSSIPSSSSSETSPPAHQS